MTWQSSADSAFEAFCLTAAKHFSPSASATSKSEGSGGSSATRCSFPSTSLSSLVLWAPESPRRAPQRFVVGRRSRVFRGDKRRPSEIKVLSPDSVERPATRFFRKAFDMVHALWRCRIWAYGGSSLPSASHPHQKERGHCGARQCRPPFRKRCLEEG